MVKLLGNKLIGDGEATEKRGYFKPFFASKLQINNMQESIGAGYFKVAFIVTHDLSGVAVMGGLLNQSFKDFNPCF